MQFSRQRIEVSNSASCKRNSDKRFEICNNARERFFRNLYSNSIYLASKLVKKRKILLENCFLLTCVGFVEKKNPFDDELDIVLQQDTLNDFAWYGNFMRVAE